MRALKILISVIISALLFACDQKKEVQIADRVNWEKRALSKAINNIDTSSTYLSVYSEIYQIADHRTYSLTVTISMRNINSTDSVYIFSAKYYNTEGNLIRTYFDKPIFIKPLETVEIVIHEGDKTGGTGANFIFEWAKTQNSLDPHFEAVMISTTGQQGLSFTTQGIKRSLH